MNELRVYISLLILCVLYVTYLIQLQIFHFSTYRFKEIVVFKCVAIFYAFYIMYKMKP